VIFELISARYERRSLLVTANRPFGSWDSIFPDPAMTVAAIDRRLVHHSIILEMNTDSYRRKSAEMKLRKKSTTASAKDALNEPSPPSEIA
jgi:DNA replication protein DnaC